MGAGLAPHRQPAGDLLPTPSAPATPATPAQPEPKFRIDTRNEVPITEIIELIRKDLGIQIIAADDLSDVKIYLHSPVEIPANRTLNFLTLLLEQKGFTLVRNSFGIYMIVPKDNVGSEMTDDPQASTQVVDTKGIKPSALQSHVKLIGDLSNAVYNDDLGVIIVTDSPGKIDLLRQLVDRLVEIRSELQFVPLEVRNIAAVTARERILGLAGEISASQGQLVAPQPGVPQQQQGKPTTFTPAGGSTVSQATSNLSFQLLVDPQSNSLLFRGRPDELGFVQSLLALVDVPNKMKSVFYEVGIRAAEVIAYQGSREGLGDMTTYQSTTEADPSGLGVPTPRQGIPNQGQPGQQQQDGSQNTAGFVIYPDAGGFMYHGTPQQHARIEQLAKDLKQLSQGDLVTMEFYKLKHAKSTDVVGILGSLLGESAGAGNTGSILGRDLGQRGDSRRPSRDRQSGRNAAPGQQQPGAGSRDTDTGGLGAVGNDETSIIDDDKNNRVIVKARQRLQPDFAKLIQRLDSRRPQVYVNAQIIAVTENQNSRFAVETQILAGQFGLNTNFGLGSFGDMGDFFSRKTVATGLPAFTAALIRSDSVPFIITALQNNTDSKILATPQLLVDDNEPASVLSENEVPTQVTQIPDTGPPIQSVGESARAGTSLEVTPQISENAVKLDVYIEQSAFTGEATGVLPPPVQRNVLQSQVTVPRDCTIVIGGLTFESDTKTVVKVPLLGDIPIVGHAFRDTASRRQRTTLYVFLTPTIMTDPTFFDLKLLTRGPAAEVDLKSDHIMPPPSLVPMKIGKPMVPSAPPLEHGDEAPSTPAAPPGPAPVAIPISGSTEKDNHEPKKIQP